MDFGECGGMDSGFSQKLQGGEGGGGQVQPSWSQQAQFYDYCMAVPVIAQAVDFSVRVQAAIKVAKDTGDDGHRLLEFSQYRHMSWCASMIVLYVIGVYLSSVL